MILGIPRINSRLANKIRRKENILGELCVSGNPDSVVTPATKRQANP
jgi:hypothetical protein